MQAHETDWPVGVLFFYIDNVLDKTFIQSLLKNLPVLGLQTTKKLTSADLNNKSKIISYEQKETWSDIR